MFKKIFHFVFFLFIIPVIGFISKESCAAEFKVLVVMSYHESMPWVKEIKEGIDSVFADAGELYYFYLDTKNNYEAGDEKAKEAYSLYLKLQPNGVITADDNAQSMFVLPYLKDKAETPVIFCGVNAEPYAYGFPASNVTGILERDHVAESIALIQQLDPSVRTIGYIMRRTPTTERVYERIKSESETYPAKSVAFKFPKTLSEAVAMTRELKQQTDALFITGLESLPDDTGKLLTEKDVIPAIARTFGKPTTSPDVFNIKYGLLCTVSKTGQEQGATAAKMLLKAMKGIPVSEIPITRNRYGKRVINVTVMKELGIKPRPIILQGAELVHTEGYQGYNGVLPRPVSQIMTSQEQ